MSSVRYIPLQGSSDKVVVVDAHNYEWLAQFKWYERRTRDNIYAMRVTKIKGKQRSYKMHREIMERKLGRTLDRWELVDHKKDGGLRNTEDNLRLVTPQQNLMNRRSSAEYKGVRYQERTGTWRAKIGFNRKSYFLGYYATQEVGAKAYDAAARYYFGEYAQTNFEGSEALSADQLRLRAKGL